VQVPLARPYHSRVTTVPTDDRAEPALLVRERVGGIDRAATNGEAAPEALEAPTMPWWRPVARYKASGRRVLPGISYPIAVYVVWRLLHLWASVAQRGKALETAYNYDGEHYLRILHYGYWNPRPSMPSHAFFPGVSWLATPVHRLTASDAIAVHVTMTLTGLAAFICVWGVSRAWKDERVARRAVLLMALMPSSLFLWAFYSEALFIALGAGGVWADRKGRRWVAAACFVAIGTTRSIGILVPAIVVLARIVHERRIDRWAVTYAAAGITGLGLVVGAVWRQVGDPLAWLTVQDDWGRSLDWPWASVIQGFDNLYPDPQTVMVPALVGRNVDLWAVPVVLAALAYLAFSRKDRFPMEAWMLGVAMIALPLVSGVLASFNRFVLATWVIYPAYASFAGRLPRWLRLLLGALLVGVCVWAGWLMIGRFSVNRFVG
jgi:hypothetical protein